MKVKRAFISVLILFMLPACVRVRRPVHLHQQQSVSELLARCFDIFIPVNAQSLQDKSPHSENEMRAQFFIQYTVNCHSEELSRRYAIEMERLGWLLLTTFTSYELYADSSQTLLFQKPDSVCCVIIDPSKSGNCHVRCMRSPQN